MRIDIEKSSRLLGEITPPPDKSISHRAVILASIAQGKSVIRNFLKAADTMSTVDAFRSLGVNISTGDEMSVKGKGHLGLTEPTSVIDCGNSGTTMRLLSGVLSGCPFFSILTGDESLIQRPMGRVVDPLKLMGSHILARRNDTLPPLAIRGGGLTAIRYEMPVASAQVKSALLLAGLYAEGKTEVVETVRSRDHTERMLSSFGANIVREEMSVTVTGGDGLSATEFEVPNDFSSAAFFIAAGLLVHGSDLTLRSVGVNPTRIGFLEAVERMGAKITLENEREVCGEPIADIRCKYSELHAVDIGKDMVPSLIDEFPILCVIASRAKGTTTIRGAEELRVKESDRISTVADGLKRMGVKVEEYPDGMRIIGNNELRGAEIDSSGDHRIAMAFSIAGLVAEGVTSILNANIVGISFPDFFTELRRLQR